MKSGTGTTIEEIPKTLVFRYSTPIDLARASLVSKAFQRDANTVFVWQELIRRYFPYLYNENKESFLKNPKKLFRDNFLNLFHRDVHSYYDPKSEKILPQNTLSKALVLSTIRGEPAHNHTTNPLEATKLAILALAHGYRMDVELDKEDLANALLMAAEKGCVEGVQQILSSNAKNLSFLIVRAVRTASQNNDMRACEMLIPFLSEAGKIRLLTVEETNAQFILLLLNNVMFDEGLILSVLSNHTPEDSLVTKHLLSRLGNVPKKSMTKLLCNFTRYTEKMSQDQCFALRTLLRMPNLTISGSQLGSALCSLVESFDYYQGEQKRPPDEMIDLILSHPEIIHIPPKKLQYVLEATISSALKFAFHRIIQVCGLQSLSIEALLELVNRAVEYADYLEFELETLPPLLLACPSGCFGEYKDDQQSLAEKALLAAAIEDYDSIVITLQNEHRISLSPRVIGKALGIAALNRSQRTVECILNDDRNELNQDEVQIALDSASKNRDHVMGQRLFAKMEAITAALFKGEPTTKRARIK